MIYLVFIFEEESQFSKYVFYSENARKEWLDNLSGSRVNQSEIVLVDKQESKWNTDTNYMMNI